jgi:hypothetical protein
MCNSAFRVEPSLEPSGSCTIMNRCDFDLSVDLVSDGLATTA